VEEREQVALQGRPRLGGERRERAGEPPMQYLARWRMQVAAGLLATTREGVASIAGQVGYASEAAFNRSFKKCVGEPAATWRRRRAAPRPDGRPGPAA
jgi:transcriptional regulator GlxA family with amidase domain